MLVNHFTPSMIAGCEAALDAGVFYQNEFEDFVINHMGGFDCHANLVETLVIDREQSGFTPRLEFLSTQALETKVAAMPRGHYAVIKTTDRARTFFKFVVSDGSGTIATGGKYDTYDAEPTAQHVLYKMLSHEIYLCRKFVENRRAMARDIEAITSINIHVGLKFKGYKVPGEVKPFSSATVIEIHPETGQIKLLLVRRGSSQRWLHTTGASSLKKFLPQEAEAAQNQALC